MKKLFLRRHNKVIGSLKADRLKQGVSNGKVFGTDYVAESKEGPWHLVEQVILSMKAKTTPPADSTTSTNASPPAPSVSQLEQTLRQQKVELELQRKSLAERTQNLDQRERELKLQEDELPTTLNQDSTASERTRKPDALGGLELVSDSPKPVQPNTVTLPRKNPGASPGTAKLAEHWPVGGSHPGLPWLPATIISSR